MPRRLRRSFLDPAGVAERFVLRSAASSPTIFMVRRRADWGCGRALLVVSGEGL